MLGAEKAGIIIVVRSFGQVPCRAGSRRPASDSHGESLSQSEKEKEKEKRHESQSPHGRPADPDEMKMRYSPADRTRTPRPRAKLRDKSPETNQRLTTTRSRKPVHLQSAIDPPEPAGPIQLLR